MVKKLQALRAKKGFTLVELIVVIAIIGVLAAILIPTLSGVIESSRKRSAESTCQSVQSLAKTFASTVMSKTGNMCIGDSKADMDDGKGEQTMAQYIISQVPEIAGSNDKGIEVELEGGEVTLVRYTEGAFTAEWTNTAGTKGATKSTDKEPNTPVDEDGMGAVTVSGGGKTSTADSVTTGGGDETPTE